MTPCSEICQALLSSIIFQNLLKFMSFESVTVSIHLILCHSLLFLPSVFPSIRVCFFVFFVLFCFFSMSCLFTFRRLNYWSINPSNGQSGLISFRIDGTLPTCMLSHFNCTWFFATQWTVACHAPLSMGFSSKNIGVGFLALPQGIFPTQGWNPHLLCLLLLQTGSLPPTPHGKPWLYLMQNLFWILKIN